MAASDFLQEDSDGFLKEDSNGFLLEGNDSGNCCCGCPCPECAGDSAPCTATVTSDSIDYQACDGICIDGLTVGVSSGTPVTCGTLTGFSFKAGEVAASTVDPNGVFPIGIGNSFSNCYDSDFCTWGAGGLAIATHTGTIGTGMGPDAFALLSGSSCSPFVSPKEGQPYWGWVLRKTATKWYLAFMCMFQFIENDLSTTWLALYKFYGELDATDDCTSTLTFTNLLVSGSAVAGCGPFSGVFDDNIGYTCGTCGSRVLSHGVSLAAGGEAVVTFS